MLKVFANTLNATHHYLQDLGARVAHTKIYIVASMATAKKFLADTWWPTISASIAVAGDFRYIGAHLSTTRARKHTTSEDRVARALTQLRTLRYVQPPMQSMAKGHTSQDLRRAILLDRG